jgi:hypothetical protein
MELALATKEANARSALAVASRQLLFLIALGYGLAYIVPACISFAFRLNGSRRKMFALQFGSQLPERVDR